MWLNTRERTKVSTLEPLCDSMRVRTRWSLTSGKLKPTSGVSPLTLLGLLCPRSQNSYRFI